MASRKKRRKAPKLSKRKAERQAKAAKAIRDALSEAKQRISDSLGWTAYFRVHKSKSGTVDGVLRITDLPPWTARALFRELIKLEIPPKPPRYKTVWVQMGFLGNFFSGSKDDSGPNPYSRLSGTDAVWVSSQRFLSRAQAEVNADTAAFIGKRVESKNKTIDQIVVRLFWGGRPMRKTNKR